MNRMAAFFPTLLLVLTLQPAWAGDEESLGGPYSTFDPETGFYSSGADQSATPQPHNTVPAPSDTQVSTPAMAKTNERAVPGTNVNTPYLMLAGAIVLLVGGVFGFRLYRNNSTKN